MLFRVLIPEKIADDGVNFLLQNGYEVKAGRGLDKQKLIEDLQDCDGVIVRVCVIDEEVFSKCPRLKVVASHGVGVDNIDLESAKRHNCRVTNTPTANSVAVAEHALMLMLALAKNLNETSSRYRNGEYDAVRAGVFSKELFESTLGILGLGKIGSRLAARAVALGMRVLAHDPYIDAARIPEGVLAASRDQVLSESDFISLHMPVTDETKKSIGEREFSKMKTTTIFINTARGALVDQAALIRALKEKQLFAAGLDVTQPEPVQKGCELFDMPNVIMTPHVATNSTKALALMSLGAATGVHEVLTGKPITWAIV
jgi:D-3-phosphoglycerate dehydrogenase